MSGKGSEAWETFCDDLEARHSNLIAKIARRTNEDLWQTVNTLPIYSSQRSRDI